MGKAAAPHRFGILFADAAAIAGGERGRDRARTAIYAAADMIRQPGAPFRHSASPTAFPRRADEFDLAQRLSGSSNALEPGRARKIISARHRHGRRRHQPRLQPDHRARAKLRQRLFVRKADAKLGREFRFAQRSQHQPYALPGGQLFHREHGGLEAGDLRPFQARRRHPLGAKPHKGAAERRRQQEDGERAPPPGRAGRSHKADRCGKREKQEPGPGGGTRKREPGGDAEPQSHRKPEGKLVAFTVEQPFQPPAQAGSGALQPPSHGSWSRHVRYARGAHVTGRHRPHSWRTGA